MSTKTTFKRIALVAVAALGLGMLSVVPSSATVSGLSVTVVDGTSTLSVGNGTSDSLTAGTVVIAGLLGVNDSVTVEIVLKSVPAGGSTAMYLQNLDSATSSLTAYTVDTLTSTLSAGVTGEPGAVLRITPSNTTAWRISKATSAGNINHKFGVQLDSATAGRIAGTFTFTVLVKAFDSSSTVPASTISKDINITIAVPASASKVVSATFSTGILASGSTWNGGTVDSAVSVVSTASATAVSVVRVILRNASNLPVATESVTATITGPGQIGRGTVFGKSIVLVHAAGDFDLDIRPDGTAGVSKIIISTPSVTFTTKTINFYAAAAKTITATVLHPTLAVGGNTGAVKVDAVDVNGVAWTGAAYIYASTAADALIGGSLTTPVACAAWNSTDGILCPITTLLAGTAKLKVIDAATVALATATSNEVTVTVSSATAATVKLAFDKATYGPNEKAFITVTPLDSAGKTIPGGTLATLLATGGITSSLAFTSGSDTLTAVSITTSALTGSAKYTVYMPAQGTVTITATGGASLPLAGQVAVTATATAVNAVADALSQAAIDAGAEAADAANAATDAANAAAEAADAATAAAEDATDAVAALATQVATLVAGLKAQLTALTNLIIKIQRSVKKLQN